jgi:hypothetical protein
LGTQRTIKGTFVKECGKILRTSVKNTWELWEQQVELVTKSIWEKIKQNMVNLFGNAIWNIVGNKIRKPEKISNSLPA